MSADPAAAEAVAPTRLQNLAQVVALVYDYKKGALEWD